MAPSAAWQGVSLGKIIFRNLFAFLFKLSFAKQVWKRWRAPNLVPPDLCSLD